MYMGFLAGKKILITGLLSNRSIAYGIAQACHREGAELAFTYQNERFTDRVTKMAADFDSSMVFACDVARRCTDRRAVRTAGDQLGRSGRSGALHRLCAG
jgi:enoyl-[acyl-carrier-protein] reductase (NADH)